MRVVAIVPAYPPGARVGAFLATHELLAFTAAAGHDVTVFVSRDRGRPYDLDGVEVVSAIQGRSHAFRLARDADVVVSHCGDDGLGLDVAVEVGRPSVRMFHGASREPHRLADLVVFNSSASAAGAPYRFGHAETIVRPFTDPARHRVERTGDAVTLVNCSREKGIRTAWRAAEDLPHRAFLGVLGGYGNQEVPRARNFATIPTTADMRTVWERSRMLLVPSVAETWGMVAAEALTVGLPVIAHPTPGLVECLGDAGVFVDRDDRAEWARQIERFFDDAEWAKARIVSLARARDLPDDRPRFVEALERVAAGRMVAA